MTEPWEKYEADFNDDEKKIAREMNESQRRFSRGLGGLGHYILDEHNVAVPVPFGTWVVWFERENHKPNRGRVRVAFDEWDDAHYGHVRVSTVFLGIDHSFGGAFGDSVRRLFETMIFWGWSEETAFSEQNMWRYPTYDRANIGHVYALQRTKRFLSGEITREQYSSDDGRE